MLPSKVRSLFKDGKQTAGCSNFCTETRLHRQVSVRNSVHPAVCLPSLKRERTLDLLKAEKCLTEVTQKVHILKKSSFLLMTPFTFWALIAKCAILCGKSLHRVKIHKICYYFHYCNMLGVNWKWYFFSKEWFLQGKKLGKFDISKLVWRKKLTKF